MKSKVDKLNVDKLIHIPIHLSKLSDVVKNDVVKKHVFKDKTRNIEDKIPAITNLATNTSLNAKINKVKCLMSKISNLATTIAINFVENKIPSVSILVNKTDYNTKINEIEKKVTDQVFRRNFWFKTKTSKFSK